jgi:hypothetical protein
MMMRNWLIKLLGGFTKDDTDRLMQNCEDFAREYLTPLGGKIAPDASFYNPFDGDDLCIMRSQITIMGGRVAGMVFAPWCRMCSVQSAHVTGERPNIQGEPVATKDD